METRVGRRILSGLLIIALSITMLFVDCSIASATTERGAVKAIKYIYPSSVTYEEHTNGQWSLDSQGDFYYRYRSVDAEPEVFTVEYENGEEITYSMIGGVGDPYYSVRSYRGSDGANIDLYNCVKSSQDQERFEPGNDNYFIFQFGGKQVKIPVTITPKTQQETNVIAIAYQPIVNNIGYDNGDIVYNGEKDKEQMYFFSSCLYPNKGDKLIVEYDGGVSKTYTCSAEEDTGEYYFSTDEGERLDGNVSFSDDQDIHEWGDDANNYYIVEYGGAFTKVPITVKENDVTSVALYVKPDSEQIEIACDTELYDEYGNWNNLIDGITVYKTDGMTENIIYNDERGGFLDEGGNEIDLMIGHQGKKDSGQWYVYYHGVRCEIPTAHYNTSWEIKEKPTCNSIGIYEKKCICGEVTETSEIPIDKDAHSFTNYVYNNDAKVGIDGTETAVCDNGCGVKNTRTKPGTALNDGGSSGGDFVPSTPTVPTEQKPVISEGEGYSTFIGDNGKTVLIIVEDEYELTDVKVNGVSKGAKKKITGLKSKDKVEVFVITKAEKIQQIKSTLETVNWKNFLTRSAQVKMKSGKKAIKLTFVNQSEVPFDGIEVFRSMKKNSGYGTKPIFTTTNDKYYNTAIKKGKRYYYKARGYIEYDGVKYYSDWSAKAWRTVK